MVKKEIYFIIGIMILLVILISFVFYFNYDEDNDMGDGGTQTREAGDVGGEEQGDKSVEVEDTGRDLPGESGDFGGGGSGGGGGAGGSGAQGAGDSGQGIGSGTQGGGNCIEVPYSYALKNLNVISNCNNLQNNICVDKRVDCSIKVSNLDSNGGVFSINFVFFERGGDGTPLQSIIKESFVGPLSSVVFGGSFNVQSEGESGNANKNIECWALTDKTPVSSVCS